MKLDEFEEGEKVLFNSRKTPLTVKKASENSLLVDGPSGGKYEIYVEDKSLLFCRKGSKRYSSYCKKLRSVGEWERKDDCWVHSVSKAEIRVVEKSNGFWTVKSEKFDDELDTPMYGFSSKDFAIEEAKKFVDSHPEG